MEARRGGPRRVLIALQKDDAHGGAAGRRPGTTAVPTEEVDIDSLDVFDVLYLLCEGDGLVVAGDPSRAFAHFDATRGVLHVYTRSEQAVEVNSGVSSTLLSALECVLKDGAKFSSVGEDAVCVLGNVTARGRTRGEAAIRALAKQQLSQ